MLRSVAGGDPDDNDEDLEFGLVTKVAQYFSNHTDASQLACNRHPGEVDATAIVWKPLRIGEKHGEDGKF